VLDSFTGVNVTMSSGLVRESALGVRIDAMLGENVMTFGILGQYLEKADVLAALDLKEVDFFEGIPQCRDIEIAKNTFPIAGVHFWLSRSFYFSSW
jgi:hypothetical protein